jgi:hypothetical protein
MGAYDNPQATDWSQIMRAVTRGIADMGNKLRDNDMAFRKYQATQRAEANKVINKGKTKAEEKFETAKQELQQEMDGFTGKLTTYDKEGKKTQAADAITFETQLENIFVQIGDETKAKIEEIEARGGSLKEIRDATNESISKMKKITNDVAAWSSAYSEYDKAITKAPNKEGALLRNQTNSQLINMFDAASDTEKGNLMLAVGDNGHLVVSLGRMEGEAGEEEWKAESVLDVSAWSQKNAGKDNSYFEEVQGFTKKDYSILKTTIADLKKDKRFLDDKGDLDGAIVKEYLMGTGGFEDDQVGRTLMNDYLIDPIEARGQWRTLASPKEVQELNKNNDWATYDEAFSEDEFLGKLIDNTLDLFYKEEFALEEEK